MSLFTTSRVSKQDILRIADQIIPQHATTTSIAAAGRAAGENSLDSAFSLLSSLSTASAHESLPPALATVMTQLGPDWQMDLIGRCLASAQSLIDLQQYRKALAYIAAALSLPIFRYNLALRLPVSLLTAHAEEVFSLAAHTCSDTSPAHSTSSLSLPSSTALPVAQCPFDAAPALCSPMLMHLHGYDFAAVFGVRRKQRPKASEPTNADADQAVVRDGDAMTDVPPVAAPHKVPRVLRATSASTGSSRTRTPAGAPGKAKLDWSLLTEVRDLCTTVYSHVLHRNMHTPSPHSQATLAHADGDTQVAITSLLALARSSPAPLATLPLSATPLLPMHAPEPASSSSALTSTSSSSSSSSYSTSPSSSSLPSTTTGWLQPLAPYMATPAACAALASVLSLFEVCVVGMLRRHTEGKRDAQLLLNHGDGNDATEHVSAGATMHPVAALGGSTALMSVLTAVLPVLRLSLLCARLICTRSLPTPVPPAHAAGYITVARASPLFAAVPALLTALRREVARRAVQLRDDTQEARDAAEGTRQRLPSKRTAAPTAGAATAPAAVATPFAPALAALAAQTDAATTASVVVVIAPVRAEHVRLHSLRHCGCLFCEAVAVCGELRRRGLPLSARGVEVFISGEYAQLLRDDAPAPALAPASEDMRAAADDAPSPSCGMLGRTLLDRRLQQGRDAFVPELAAGAGAVTITCCHPLLARLARPQHALEPFLLPAPSASTPHSVPSASPELLPPLSALAHDLLVPLAAAPPVAPLTPRWSHWLPPHVQHAHAALAPLSPLLHLLHVVPHHPLPLPPLASLLRACTDTRMLTTFASATFAALRLAAAPGTAHVRPTPITATVDAALATLALQRVAALQASTGRGQLSSRRAGFPSRSHGTHALLLDAGHTRAHPHPRGAVALSGTVGSAAVCAAQLSLLNSATALAIAPPSAQVTLPVGDAACAMASGTAAVPGGVVDTAAFDAVREQLGRQTSCVPSSASRADATPLTPPLSSLLVTGCAVAVIHSAAGLTVMATSLSTELPPDAAAAEDEDSTETVSAADWETDVSALQSRWCVGVDSAATEHVLSRAAVRATDAASNTLVARAGQHALALAHAHAAQLAVPALTVMGSRTDAADAQMGPAQDADQRSGTGTQTSAAVTAASSSQPASGRVAPALPSLPQDALLNLQTQRAQLAGALADPVTALVEATVLTHQEADEAADASFVAMDAPTAGAIAPLAALADAAPASSLPALAVRAILLAPPSQESLLLFTRAAHHMRTLLLSLHPVLRRLTARLRAVTAAPLSPGTLAAFAAILLEHHDDLARAFAAIDPLLLVATLSHAHVVAGMSVSIDVSIPGGVTAPQSSAEASLLAVAGPALTDTHALVRLLHNAQTHASAKLTSPAPGDSASPSQHSLRTLSSAIASSPVLAFSRALTDAYGEYTTLAATHAHPLPPRLLLSRGVEPADVHRVSAASSAPRTAPFVFPTKASPSVDQLPAQPRATVSSVRAPRRARAAAASIPVMVSTLRPRVAAQAAEERSQELECDVSMLFASVAGLARACGMGIREPFLFHVQAYTGDGSTLIPGVGDAMDAQKDLGSAAGAAREVDPVPLISSLSGDWSDCLDVSVHMQTPVLDDHSLRGSASDADEGLFSDSSQSSQDSQCAPLVDADDDDSLASARALAAAGEDSTSEDADEGENGEVEEGAEEVDDESKAIDFPNSAPSDMDSEGEDEDTDDEGLYSPASPRTTTLSQDPAAATGAEAGAGTLDAAVEMPSVAMTDADAADAVDGTTEAAKVSLPATIEAAAPLPEIVSDTGARGAARRLSRRQAALAAHADRKSESVGTTQAPAEEEQPSVKAREVARQPQLHVKRPSPASASGSSPLPRAALSSALLAMTPAQALAAAYLPLVTFHNAPSIVQPLPSALLVHAMHISALLSGPHESAGDSAAPLVALPNGVQLPLRALQRARRAMRAAMNGQQRYLETIQAAQGGDRPDGAAYLGTDASFPDTDVEVNVNMDHTTAAAEAPTFPAALHQVAARVLQWLLVDAPATTPAAVDALFASSTDTCIPLSPAARTLTAHCATALVQLSAAISWQALAPTPAPPLLALVPHALTLLLPAASLPVLPQLNLSLSPTVLARVLDALTPQHSVQTAASPARACCVWLLGSLAALLAELLCGALFDPVDNLPHVALSAATAAPASLVHHRALSTLRGSPDATLAALRASYNVAQHALQMLAVLAAGTETPQPDVAGSMADTDMRSIMAHTCTASPASLSQLAAALRARMLLLTLRTGLPALSLSVHATVTGKHSIPAVQVSGGPSLEEKQVLLAQLARVLGQLPQRSLALPHLSPALLGCPNAPANATAARAGPSASATPHPTESLARARPLPLVLAGPLLRACAAELAHHRALVQCDALLQQQALAHATEHAALAHARAQNCAPGAAADGATSESPSADTNTSALALALTPPPFAVDPHTAVLASASYTLLYAARARMAASTPFLVPEGIGKESSMSHHTHHAATAIHPSPHASLATKICSRIDALHASSPSPFSSLYSMLRDALRFAAPTSATAFPHTALPMHVSPALSSLHGVYVASHANIPAIASSVLYSPAAFTVGAAAPRLSAPEAALLAAEHVAAAWTGSALALRVQSHVLLATHTASEAASATLATAASDKTDIDGCMDAYGDLSLERSVNAREEASLLRRAYVDVRDDAVSLSALALLVGAVEDGCAAQAEDNTGATSTSGEKVTASRSAFGGGTAACEDDLASVPVPVLLLAHAVADAAALALQLQTALNTCPPLPLLAAVDTHTADTALDATPIHRDNADTASMDDSQTSRHSAELCSAKWRLRVVTPAYTGLLDLLRCLHAPSASANALLSTETTTEAIPPPSAAHLPIAPLPVHTLQSLLARALRCFRLLSQLARVYGADVEFWLQTRCCPTSGQALPSRGTSHAPSKLLAAILRGHAWQQLQLGLHRLFFASALSSFACSTAAKERDIQRDEARAHLLAVSTRGRSIAAAPQAGTRSAASPNASFVGAADQAVPAHASDSGPAHGAHAEVRPLSADAEATALLWARAREEETLSTAPLASLAAQLAPGLACLCLHVQLEMHHATRDISTIEISTDAALASSAVPTSPLAELAPSLLAFAALLPSAAYALTPYLTERAGAFPVRLPGLPTEPPQSTAPPPPHPLLLAAADEVAVRLLAASLALTPLACSPAEMALLSDPCRLLAVARAHPAALGSLRTAAPPLTPTALLASPVAAVPSPLLAHSAFQFHMLRALTLPHAVLPLLHHVRLFTSIQTSDHSRALNASRTMMRAPSLSPLLPLLLSSAVTGAMDEFAMLAYPLRAHTLDMPSPFAAAKSLAWATYTAADGADGALTCVGRWLGDADRQHDHFVSTFTPARALAALSDAAATYAQAHAAVSRTVIVGTAHALVLLWLEQQQLASMRPSAAPSSSGDPVAEALQGLVASGILASGAARALHALVAEVLGAFPLSPAAAADIGVPFLLCLAALIRARDAKVVSPVLLGWLLTVTDLPVHVTAVSTVEHPALESLLCCLRTHVSRAEARTDASHVSVPVHPAAVDVATVGAGMDVVRYMLADTEDLIPATTFTSLHPTVALPMRPPSETLWRLPLSRCRPARVDGEPYAATLTWPSALVALLHAHLPAAIARDFTLPSVATTGFDTDDDLHHSLQLFSPTALAPCDSLSSASARLHPALAHCLLHVTRQHYALFAASPSRATAPPPPSIADAHADFLQHQLHTCLFGDVAHSQRQLADTLVKAAAAEREAATAAAAATASSASAPSVVRAHSLSLPGARGPIAWRTVLAYVEAGLRAHVHAAVIAPESAASDACGEALVSSTGSSPTDTAAADLLSYFFPASLAAVVTQLPLRSPCDLAVLATPHTTLLGYWTASHAHTRAAVHIFPPHTPANSALVTITIGGTALPCAPPSPALLSSARCVLDHLAMHVPRAPLLHRLALATHPATLLAHLVNAMPGTTTEHTRPSTTAELALRVALASVPAQAQAMLTLTPLFDACSLAQLSPVLSTPASTPDASSDRLPSRTTAPSHAVSAATLLLAWLVARNSDVDNQPMLPYLLTRPTDAHYAAAHALLPIPLPFTSAEVVIALQLLASELARLAPQVAESVAVLATLSARKRAALYKSVEVMTSLAPAFLALALALPPRVLPAELAPSHALPLALRCLALAHHCHSAAFAMDNCPPDGETWATHPFSTVANAAITPALPPLGGVALPLPAPLQPYSWPRWMHRQAYMPCLLQRYSDLPDAEVLDASDSADNEGTAFFASVRRELYKELDACTLLPSLARTVTPQSTAVFDDTCLDDSEHGGAGQGLDGAAWADQLYALAADVLMLCHRGDMPKLLHSHGASNDLQSSQPGAAAYAYSVALAGVHAVEVSAAPTSLSPLARELLVSTLTHQLALAHVHTRTGAARSPALAEVHAMLRAITTAAADGFLTPTFSTSQLLVVPDPRAASPLARCLTPLLALAPSPTHAYALACHALRGARALSSAVRSQLLAAVRTASNPDHHSFSALLASVQIRLDSIVPQLTRLLQLYRDAMGAARLGLTCALQGWSSARTTSALSASDAADDAVVEESMIPPLDRTSATGEVTPLVPVVMVSHAMLLLQTTRAELHAIASSLATLLHDCALLVHAAPCTTGAEGSTGSVLGSPPLLLTRVLAQGYNTGMSFEVDLAAAVALLPVADSAQVMRDTMPTTTDPSHTNSTASLLLARCLAPTERCLARALAVPEVRDVSSPDIIIAEGVFGDSGVAWDGPVDTTLVPAFHSDGTTASELWPTLARHPAAPALTALPVFSTDMLLERVRAARPHARIDTLANTIAALAALAEEPQYRFSSQAAGSQEETTLSGLLTAHGFPVASAPDAIILDDIAYTTSGTPLQPATDVVSFPLFGARGVAADIAAAFICVAGWSHCGAAAASALLELQRCQTSMLLLVKALPVVAKWLLAPQEFCSDGAPSAGPSVATAASMTPISASVRPTGPTVKETAAFADTFDVDEELAELGLNAFMDLEIDLSRTAHEDKPQPVSAATAPVDQGNVMAVHPLVAANTLSGLSLPSPLALHRACALSFSLAIRHLEHFSGNATHAATASLFQCAAPAALTRIASAAGEAALVAVSPIAPPHQRASTHFSLCAQLLQAALALVDVRWSQHTATCLATVLQLLPVSKLRLAEKTAKALPVYVSQVMALLCGHWHLHFSRRLETVTVCALLATVAPLPYLACALPLARAALDRYPTVADAVDIQTGISTGATPSTHSQETGLAVVPAVPGTAPARAHASVFITPAELYMALDPHLPLLVLSIAHVNTVLRAPPSALPTTASSSTSYSSSSSPSSYSLLTLPTAPPGPSFAAIHYFRVRTVLLSCPGLSASLAAQQLLQQRMLLLLATPVRRLWHQALFDVAIDSHAHSAAVGKWLEKYREGATAVDGAPSSSLQPTRPLLASLPLPPAPLVVHALVARARLLACTQWLSNDRSMRKWTRDYHIDALTWGVSPLINDVTDMDGSSHALLTISYGTAPHPPSQQSPQDTTPTTGPSSTPPTRADNSTPLCCAITHDVHALPPVEKLLLPVFTALRAQLKDTECVKDDIGQSGVLAVACAGGSHSNGSSALQAHVAEARRTVCSLLRVGDADNPDTAWARFFNAIVCQRRLTFRHARVAGLSHDAVRASACEALSSVQWLRVMRHLKNIIEKQDMHVDSAAGLPSLTTAVQGALVRQVIADDMHICGSITAAALLSEAVLSDGDVCAAINNHDIGRLIALASVVAARVAPWLPLSAADCMHMWQAFCVLQLPGIANWTQMAVPKPHTGAARLPLPSPTLGLPVPVLPAPVLSAKARTSRDVARKSQAPSQHATTLGTTTDLPQPAPKSKPKKPKNAPASSAADIEDGSVTNTVEGAKKRPNVPKSPNTSKKRRKAAASTSATAVVSIDAPETPTSQPQYQCTTPFVHLLCLADIDEYLAAVFPANTSPEQESLFYTNGMAHFVAHMRSVALVRAPNLLPNATAADVEFIVNSCVQNAVGALPSRIEARQQ